MRPGILQLKYYVTVTKQLSARCGPKIAITLLRRRDERGGLIQRR
jgi:hypothetical protein